MLFCKCDLTGDVQSDHSNGHTGIEHHAGRFGVHVEIKLRRRTYVSAGKRSAHQDNTVNLGSNLWILAQGKSHISEWSDSDNTNLTRVVAHKPANEICCRFFDRLQFRCGKLDPCQAIVAMSVSRRDKLSRQRGSSSACNGNVGMARNLN